MFNRLRQARSRANVIERVVQPHGPERTLRLTGDMNKYPIFLTAGIKWWGGKARAGLAEQGSGICTPRWAGCIVMWSPTNQWRGRGRPQQAPQPTDSFRTSTPPTHTRNFDPPTRLPNTTLPPSLLEKRVPDDPSHSLTHCRSLIAPMECRTDSIHDPQPVHTVSGDRSVHLGRLVKSTCAQRRDMLGYEVALADISQR